MIILRAPRTVGRRVAGQMVLVMFPDLDTRALNEVAGRVWELADGRATREIARIIAAEFDAPVERVLIDVEAFAHDLEAAGFLRIER